MSVEDSVKLIQSNTSNRKSTSRPWFKTNFGVKSVFSVEDDNFSEVYHNIIYLINKNIKKRKTAKKNKDSFKSNDFGLPFMEKTTDDTVPFIVDFLFRFVETDDEDFFTQELIPTLVQKTQEAILTICRIDDDDSSHSMVCYVLKSDIWTENGEDKQRLKLIFPGTKIDKVIFNTCFINLLLEDLKKEDFFKLLTKTPIVADWSYIIQKSTDYYPIYGCKETEIECPALIYKIYKDLIVEDLLDNYSEEDESKYLLDLSEHHFFEPLHSEYFVKDFLNTEDFETLSAKETLPIILSVNYQVKHSKYNQDVLKLSAPPQKKEKRNKEQGFKNKINQEELFDQLIPLISKTRFETKYYWYTIGKCCYNIYNGSRRGYDKFKLLTPEEYIPMLDKFWYNLEKEYLSIITIMEFARQDSPDDFAEWNKNFYYPLIDRCIVTKGKDIPMARLAKKLLCMDYVFCRHDKVWYRKCAAILKRDLGALELKNDLVDILQTVFLDEYTQRCNAREEAKGVEEKKLLNARCKDVENILDNLDKGSYIETLIKSLQSELFDDNFSKYRDEDLKTLGCTNVVLEIYDDTICYRPGKLQDYITKCTDISFPTTYDDDHPKVKFLEKYYGQVHTDEEMCHFFKKDMASYLEGGNPEKYFRNFIGERNASKSKVVELLQRALGEYCVDFPADTITIPKGRSSGGPCPELEQAKGARLAIVSESSKAEPLSVVKIKKYTGNDRYWNRTLNKEGGSRALTFKLIHMSNVIAAVPDADKGYRCREVIYPFNSEWVPKPPKTEKEQYAKRKFKMDTKFSDKIKTLGQAQLYLMYKYFPIYKKEGLKKLPEVVREETMKHHREIDPFYNFINQKIDRFFIFPNEETKNRLRKKKDKQSDTDDEDSGSEYESDYDDEIENSDSESEEDDVEERRTELYKYLDPEKRTSVNDVFNAYGRWYSKFCPDTQLSLNQSDFLKEMRRDDRLGPIKKGYWHGLSIINSKRSRSRV